MSVSCPECHQDVPVESRTVTLQAGSCPGCHREVVLWSSESGTAPTEPVVEESTVPTISVEHMDGDDDCDGTLSLTVGSPGHLVGTCGDCGAEFQFNLATEGGDGEKAPEAEETPRRRSFGDRPRFNDRGGGDRGGESRSRPCRRCGGPIAFETGDDGTVTGRCGSCGNTFSLAPREDRRPGGYRGGGGGGFRSGGGFRPGGFRSGGSRFGGGGGGGGGGRFSPPGRRRFERRDDDNDDDRPRRRRRDD